MKNKNGQLSEKQSNELKLLVQKIYLLIEREKEKLSQSFLPEHRKNINKKNK
jgi:hypothetical protein